MSDTSADRLVGQEIETKCGKCKAETLHTITSVKEGKISKVMCNICNSYHLYRAKKEKVAKVKTPGTKTTRTTRRGRMSWDNLILEVQEKEVSDYAATSDFREIRAIRHKSFGIGIITKVHNAHRIEVVFKEGTKLLGQNIAADAFEGASA